MNYAICNGGTIEICRLNERIQAQVLCFVDSWSGEDVYDRFGSAGIGGQTRLASQLTQRQRQALIAVSAGRVVGLLDFIYAYGATHAGIVVHSQYRRLLIGTRLVESLLCSRSLTRPIVAECGHQNLAAVALLRACHFKPIESDPYQITWRHD